MRSRSLPVVALLASALVLANCGDLGDVAGPALDVAPAPDLVPAPQEICGTATEVTLFADMDVDVGTATIANDADHLYVTYRTRDGWPIRRTALFVGSNSGDIPTNGPGNPLLGKFPHQSRHPDGRHEVTWQVSLDEVDGARAVIAAFAEVGEDLEGAWADGDLIRPSGSWATFATHAVQECASAIVGEGGGTITSNLGNVMLFIPPGSLAGDEEITFEPGNSSNTQVIPGTVFDFGPDGLEFDPPASLTLSYAGLVTGDDIERIRPVQIVDGAIVILPITGMDQNAMTITFAVEHFSLYGLGLIDFADLAVEGLNVSPNPARVTDALTLSALIRNHGTVSVDPVDVAVTFLDPLFFVDGASPGCRTTGEIVADGVRFSCTIGPIAPGAAAPIAFDLRPQGAASGHTATIRVEAAPGLTSGVEDPSAANDADEVEVEIQPETFADLRLTGVGSTPANLAKAGLPVQLHANAESKVVAGADPVDATLTYQFATGAPSLDILFDQLPADCSGTQTPNFTTISCDVGTLSPGAAVSRTVSVRPRVDGPFSATITIHPTANDPTPTDNDLVLSFVAENLQLDLAIASLDESLDELNVHETLVYGAAVENLASSLDAPVEAILRIEVVGDAAFDDATPGCIDVSDDVGGAVAINCPLPQLPPGTTSQPYHLVLHPTSPGQTLEATARLLLPGWHDDPDETNNSATETTRVRADNEVDFVLRNFAESADPVKAYEALTYSADILLNASSAGGTTGGTYQLQIEGNVEVIGTSDPACTSGPLIVVPGVRVTCPLGAYTAPASKTFTVDVRGITAPQTLEASATIIPPANVTEVAPGDESTSASTGVSVLVADLFLNTIGDTPDPVPAGDVVQYGVYALSNGGGDDMPRVIVQFRVDGDAELVSMPTAPGVSCTDLSSGNLLAVVVNCDIEPLRAGIASPQLLFDVRALSGPTLQAAAEIFPIPAYAQDPDLSDNLQTEETQVGAAPSAAVVYVASRGDDQVVAVNPNDNSVIATIPVGDGPQGLRVTPDGSELWVLNRISGTITIISTTTHAVIATLVRDALHPSIVGDLYDIDFSPDGSRAYITVNDPVGSARVLVLNAPARTEVTNIFLPTALPRAIRVLPGGAKAYIAASGGIDVLDLATNTVATTVAFTGGAHGLTVAGDGSAIYFTQEPDNLTGLLREIDPATDALVGAGINVGIDPRGVVVNSTNTRAFVAEERNRVYFVDLVAGTASNITTALGTKPMEIAITADDLSLFVGFFDSGQVAEVDVAGAAVVGTTAVGTFPGAVVVRD